MTSTLLLHLARCAALAAALLAPAAWAAPFTDNNDGTVTDAATGLVWDQCYLGQGGGCFGGNTTYYDWANALTAAKNANAANYKGHNDWRLPNVRELRSLVDVDKTTAPLIDTVFSSPGTGGRFWSSTTYAPNPAFAWIFGFNIGGSGNDTQGSHYYVRLVRSGQSFAFFDSLADTTAPGITTGPTVTPGADGTSADASVTLDKAATGFWQVLLADHPTPPGALDLLALGAAQQVNMPTAGTAAPFTITGLTKGTAYKLHFIARDSAGNATAVQRVAFTTPADCGSAHNTGTAPLLTSAPTANLCDPASTPTVTGGTNTWTWTCPGNAAPQCQAPRGYTVSTSTGGNGTVSAAQTVVVYNGTTTLTVTPATDYEVDTVTGCGVSLAGGIYTTGQIQADCTVSATFKHVPINGQCGSAHGGVFTSAPSTNLCNPDAAPSVTGTGPWNWVCSGQHGGSNANCSASLQAWAVTASASPAQGGTATCSPASVAHGGTATCTATASTGYQFTAWTGACASQGASCTLANVTAAQDSVAQFTQNTLPVPEGPQAGEPLAVVVQPANGWQLTQASTQTVASLHAPALPPGVTLPQGVVRLRLALGTQGSEATVVLTYPQALPAGTVYYKFGKTQDNQQLHWYPFPGAQVSGNTITLTLKDGGAGDDDLQQNSVIDDPGGPALLAAPSSPASIPTLGEWALALLAAALGLFSLGALRRANASRRV